MGKIIGEGITFDDVLLVPAYSEAVSYTHLDVYKRQAGKACAGPCCRI